MRIDGMWFKDEHGRTLILRGVNLGGSTKVPLRPNGATHVLEGFYDHRNVSFVGRPFPLEEADEHFSRLRAWGFTFLRFLITWEAVEHAGPGIYDEEYLDYLYQVVRKAGEYGIDLFIDPHQDVWGRLSGGDGAPGWTFEVVGMDATHFSKAGAAIVHCIHGESFPRMIWPTNYTKLAAATMFTLFFGGNDFAPRTIVDGEPVQKLLQRHYINAIKQVALRLKGLSNVVGYDTLNEPSPGLIGWTDLNSSGGMLRLGESPTPFQAMLLGAGFPQEVEVWSMRLTGPKLRGRRLANPDGVRVWREGYDCIWKENGVWGLDVNGAPCLLRPHHFVQVGNRSVDFANDYLRPFANRYARAIRSVDPDAIIFVEGAPGESPPDWRPEDVPKVVHGAHWYDGVTLFTKNFVPFLGVDFHTHRLIFGRRRVQRSFVEQLAHIKNWADERMGTIPTLIGEFGIPFDMRDKRAYRTSDFSLQTKAMDASFRAMEANLLNCTLWNYTADNDNRWGDQWNDEDLSIFSRDQQADPGDVNSGGRALEAVVRPYARKVAGEPLRMHFDLSSRTFEFEFRHDPSVRAATEVFVPNYQYPEGYAVGLSDGTYKIDRESQTLTVQHTPDRETHTIRVWPAAS
ncbi:MAG: cellulase family glycosylhydrolase [Chloroflexota bacterium]|nr:cellulase family glycosylhydrolase [Chloroflexota bacterium]